MANFNKVYLMGNLTRDPEIRVTPKGTAICQFGLATNRSWKDESGQAREEVTFVDVEAWGKVADVIAKYMVKGKQIFIEGRLKFEQWEDKTSGQKRSKLKIVLENFQFIGGRGDGESAPEKQTEAPAERQPAPKQSARDEDVPF